MSESQEPITNSKPLYFVVGLILISAMSWWLVSGYTASAIYAAIQTPPPITEGGCMVAATGFDLFAQLIATIVTGVGALGVSVWCGLLSVAGNVITRASSRRDAVTKSQVKEVLTALNDKLKTLRDETENATQKIVSRLAHIENIVDPPAAKPPTPEEELAALKKQLEEKGISLDHPKPSATRKRGASNG